MTLEHSSTHRPARLRGIAAGVVALAIPLTLPSAALAAESEATFVVVSGRQSVHDAEQVCFALVGSRQDEDRVQVRVRFVGTAPRGSLALDGQSAQDFDASSKTYTFLASTQGVHRLTLDLRETATMDWLSISATTSSIQQAACSSYERDAARRVRFETREDEPIYRFEPSDDRTDAQREADRQARREARQDDREDRRADRDAREGTYSPAVTIPAGTEFELSLDHAIGSQTHRTGQQVPAHLVSPVLADGRTALRTGVRVIGTVTEARKAGRFGRSRLGVTFDHLLLDDGTRVPISARLERLGPSSGGKQAGAIAGSAVGGALAGSALGVDPILGAVVGGGIATGVIASRPGKPVALPAGTVLVVKLDGAIEIPRTRNP